MLGIRRGKRNKFFKGGKSKVKRMEEEVFSFASTLQFLEAISDDEWLEEE